MISPPTYTNNICWYLTILSLSHYPKLEAYY